jgi:hypothetical protein
MPLKLKAVVQDQEMLEVEDFQKRAIMEKPYHNLRTAFLQVVSRGPYRHRLSTGESSAVISDEVTCLIARHRH